VEGAVAAVAAVVAMVVAVVAVVQATLPATLPLSLLEEGKAASIVLARHRLRLEVRAVDPIPHQWVAVPGLPNSPLQQHQRHYQQRRPPRQPSISSPQLHRRYKHTPIRVSVVNLRLRWAKRNVR
jgi:hypothetical protein